MDELEDRLRGIKVAEPPLGFDPDDVATTAAKKVRNRRAVAMTGTATLAVIVAAVMVLAPGSGPTLVSPATASSVPPVPQVQSPKVNLTVQKARNLQHLKDVVGGVFPGAKDIAVRDFVQMYGDNDWDSITASVGYRDSAGKRYGFNLTINGPVTTKMGRSVDEYCNPKTPEGAETARAEGPDGKPKRCDRIPRPGGGTVIISEGGPVKLLDGRAQIGKITMRNAMAFLPDGTSVGIFDHGIRTAENDGLELGPSLTDAQLLALATDPAFNLK